MREEREDLKQSYGVHEFAELAGVTVRALHHYDVLGLLRPARSASGYRLYRLADLERLEQIAALKFIGLPLKQIKRFLENGLLALPGALRLQRQELEKKRNRIDRALQAISDAERAGSGMAAATLLQR